MAQANWENRPKPQVGDIWLIDLWGNIGCETGNHEEIDGWYPRPCVVVAAHIKDFPTIQVVPVLDKIAPDTSSTCVGLGPGILPLNKPAFARCAQIRTIDIEERYRNNGDHVRIIPSRRTKLYRRYGKLGNDEMKPFYLAFSRLFGETALCPTHCSGHH